MSEVASAFVTLVPSFKGGKAAITREMGGDLDRAGADGGKRFGTGFKSSFSGMAKGIVGPLVGAFAAVKVGGFFKDAVTGASDLVETSTKLEAIFGDAAAEVQKFGAGGAKALGQSKQAVLDAAATFGTFGKAAGLTDGKLAKFSTGFAALSTDLASFNNTSPEEAVAAIGSALRGEAEPLRKYGVLLDDASMRQKALKLGLIKTTKQALTPQNKILAAQALIYEQTKDAQGDFKKTSGGLANQQRILAAQWTDMKANLGRGLLPVVTSFARFFNDRLVPGLKIAGGALKDVFDSQVASRIGAVKQAVSGLFDLIVKGDFTGAFRRAFNVEEDAPVVGAILRIRDGIVGVFELLRTGKFSEAFGRAFNVSADSKIVQSIQGVRDLVINAVTDFTQLPGKIADALSSAFAKVKPDVAPLVGRIREALVQTGGDLLSGITTAIETGDFRPLGQAIGKALSQAVVAAGGAAALISGGIAKMFAGVDWGALGLEVGRKAVPFVAGLIIGFTANLGEALVVLKDHWREGLIAALTAIPVGRLAGLLSGAVSKIPILRAFDPLLRGLAAVGKLMERAVGFVLRGVARIFGEVLERLVPGLVSRLRGALDTVVTTIYVKASDFRKAGIGLLAGLAAGIRNGVVTVLAELVRLPVRIVKAVGNVSRILYNAGRSIIQGLISGIGSKFGDVKNKLGELTGKLTDWKGPANKDAKLLYGAGVLVMSGFERGLRDSFSDVRSTLADATDLVTLSTKRANLSAVTAAAGTAAGSAPTYIIQPRSVGDEQQATTVVRTLRNLQYVGV